MDRAKYKARETAQVRPNFFVALTYLTLTAFGTLVCNRLLLFFAGKRRFEGELATLASVCPSYVVRFMLFAASRTAALARFFAKASRLVVAVAALL